jgi:hypothetical protein
MTRPDMESANASRAGALAFSIGDIRIALISDDPDLYLEVPRATKHFLVDNNDDADVTVRARWGELRGPAAGKQTFDSGCLWRLYQENSHYLFRFTSPAVGTLPYKQACFSSDFTSGDVVLHREYFRRFPSVNVLEYPLDELLMVNLLTLGRGVEVHACGIEDSDGRGYLFLGQSGAGKTTTARLWNKSHGAARGIQILSDDRVILRRLNGKIWMYGTPWHGEAEFAYSTRTPLTQIFFLGRGEKNEVVPVRPIDAVARLMACSFVPFYNAAALDYALAFFEQLTKAIPCGELRFAPDERVLEFVREYTDEYRPWVETVC